MTSSKTALVHYVNPRPLANLLGFLAVRPALCVQIMPSDSQRRAQALATAMASVSPETTLETVEVPVVPGRGIPDGDALRRTVGAEIAALRESGYEPVVHVTADNSPAAFAVLAGALDANARILYVDTNAKEGSPVVSDPVGSSAEPMPAAWHDAARVADVLTPELIAAAHGAKLVPGRRDPEAFLACALQMASFGPKQWAALRDVLPDVASGKLPEKLLEMADKPVYLPGFAKGLEEAGLACGIFVRSGSGVLHLAMPDEQREILRTMARERAAFVKFSPEEWKFRLDAGAAGFRERYDFLVGGGWFGVLVWDRLRHGDRCRQVLWNPCLVTGQGAEELDGVYAVEGLNLAAFACRLGGAETGLPAVIGDLGTRATRFGGASANKYLALALQPQNLNELAVQARAQNIRIIGDSRAFRSDSERDPFLGFKLP